MSAHSQQKIMLASNGERLMTDMQDPQILIEHLHRYLLARRYCEGKTVLDIACGEGYGSKILAASAKHVTGIDIDPQVIKHASSTYPDNNIHFKTGSVEDIPLESGTIDVVVSFETLEHVEAQHKMMAELKRVIKKDGTLIMSTPDKKYYADEAGYNNPYHTKELYSREFRDLLEKYFTPVQLMAQFAGGTSVIYPFQHPAIDHYWWGEGEIFDCKMREEIPAKYLIGIAGGSERIPVELSVFNGKIIEERIFKKQWNSVLHSGSYRLGKAITAPYRWIKHLFSKPAR